MSSRNGFITVTALALALLIAVVLLAQGLRPRSQPLNFVSFPATPEVDAIADARFRAEIAPMDDVNDGLGLKRVNTIIMQGVPTPRPNYISLLILNHTAESIVFTDIGFHIQVFSYLPGTQTWIPVDFVHVPERTEKILPPKLETLDFDVLNTWDILPGDLPPTTPQAIRLMVSGMGTKTGHTYAAYLDVTLQR